MGECFGCCIAGGVCSRRIWFGVSKVRLFEENSVYMEGD